MKKILQTLKMSFYCQIIGVVCCYIAYFAPLGSEVKMGLLVFGSALILCYIISIYLDVYKPLKDKEEK